MAVLCGPAGNKFLFGNENKLVAAWWPLPVRKLFGRCLITIRGDEAKWMRKMLLSYLGPDAFVTHYAATMDVVTRRHIEVHWRGKEEVNVFQTVKLYAFELACRLFLSLEEPSSIAFLKGIIELPIDIPGTRFYNSKKAAAAIRIELVTLIKERRVELEEGRASASQDLLSHLLTSPYKNGRYLTEKEIANNILLLLFAGLDTSAVTITLLMKSLVEHPDVYDKVLKVSYIIWRNSKSGSRSKVNLPPGSLGWPLIGESLSLLRAARDGVPERFVRERIDKHGSPLVFKTSLLGDRMAVLCGPAGNKFLFGNENKLVATWWPSGIRKLFGRCLITIRGDEAKWMRKMLLSYLSPDAFASHYASTMDVVTRRHLDIYWRGKEEVKVFETVKLYAFELACRLFLSLEDPNHIAKLGSLFNIFLKGMIELPIDFPGTRFYSSKKAAAAIRTELMTIIKARRVALQQQKASSSQDLLSHLLTSSDKNGRFLTEIEIANNILLLLFAGHDTSTVSITLLMKRLGEHPDVYEKVLREQLEISKAKEVGKFLNWEDIQKMRYSWDVVCEVMRLSTPVTGAFREALVDFEYAGYTIPKGWKLYWSAASTHKDEANFEDVLRFNPSRFEGAGPTPFTFVPFGGGPRMCLGKEFARLEVLAFLHNIIINFKWDLLIPDEKIEYDPMATPAKGLPIRLHPHQV